MRPLIGLSTYREQAQWGVWDQPADLLPAFYARSLERAGGVPVLLPPVEKAIGESSAEVVRRLDGLVITGGADLDPALYAKDPHPRTAGWRSDRDGWESALLDAADDRDLPTLGICRGMQLMAVHAGGSLDQHTPDVVGHEGHSPGGDVFGPVTVSVMQGTRVSTALAVNDVEVSCHHHQSVREHPRFIVAARSTDGTVEAMERPGDRFCVAVQWHPEVREDAGLFRALIAAATVR